MPLETEPCEGPCPVIDEVMEGSGNATTNATDAVGEDGAEEGKLYYDIAVYVVSKSKHLGWHIIYNIFEKVNAKSIMKTCGFSEKMKKWKMQMQTARKLLTQEVEREVATLVRI